MGKGKKAFSEDVKIRALLWSDRHCCLCGKPCGTDIEVHHIKTDSNDLSNAIPLCYGCHAQLERYNEKHPMGNKYSYKELRARRDQIYETYTRHLVPPIDFQVTQRIGIGATRSSPLPRVGFNARHLGGSFPVRFRIRVKAFLGGKELRLTENPKKPYYSGGMLWNLNPRNAFFGNFSVPSKCVKSAKDLKLEVQVTIIDVYRREHELLPVCFTYMRGKNDWFMEPTSFDELRRFSS